MGCGECTFQPGASSNGPFSNGGRVLRRATTVRGTADGSRRSTVGTLTMGTWAGTGESLAWYIASDVPSTSPSQRSNSGAHRETYSTHTYAFQRSCPHDSCNTPVVLRDHRRLPFRFLLLLGRHGIGWYWTVSDSIERKPIHSQSL